MEQQSLNKPNASMGGVLLDQMTNKPFLKITPLDEDISAYERKAKYSSKVGKDLEPFIRQLPMLAASEQLGSAYKIVFPPGVAGELVKHVNNPHLRGLPMTAIRGADGQLVGQAGLKSLALLQAPIIAFVVMSAITGQYFQARIEHSVRRISQQIDNIIQMILAEKEAEIRSIYHYTQHVSENLAMISNNNELRLATLINIQRNNITLYSLIKFYEKNIGHELDRLSHTGKDIKAAKFFKKSEIGDLKEQISNISVYLEKRHVSIDLYMMGRAFEIQLASIYDCNYLKNYQITLNEIDESNTQLMNRVVDAHKDVFSIQAVREEQSIPVGQLEERMRALDERKKCISDSIKNMIAATNEINDLDKYGMQCVFHGDQLHILES